MNRERRKQIAVAREKMIERPDAKGQHRPARRRDARHGVAKRLELLGARPGLR